MLCFLTLALFPVFCVVGICLLCSWRRQRAGPCVVAFFHPYCNAGGGGERVLWCAIASLYKRHSHIKVVVFTGDEASPQEIISKAQERFNLQLPEKFCSSEDNFIYLKCRALVEAKYYPVFTLLGQSIGGFLLGCEALWKCCPHLFFDSMGYPFTLPLFRYVAGCEVAAYVHYPTISTDMLDKVCQRRPTYNNLGMISRSPTLTTAKLIYYKLFAKLYSWAGRSAQVVMVNSTWTFNHIESLWKGTPSIVYPPCDTDFSESRNSAESLLETQRQFQLVSVGQFRPEKDHELQLRILRELLDSLSRVDERKEPILVLIGSCRNAEDMLRVECLKKIATELKIESNVRWRLGVPFHELELELSKSLIGLHTMWNEHFGIGIVEGMAAGNIMVAHNSGGPKTDILSNGKVTHESPVGFLAEAKEEYAKAICRIVDMSQEERELIRQNALERIKRFSKSEFEDKFLAALQPLLSSS